MCNLSFLSKNASAIEHRLTGLRTLCAGVLPNLPALRKLYVNALPEPREIPASWRNIRSLVLLFPGDDFDLSTVAVFKKLEELVVVAPPPSKKEKQASTKRLPPRSIEALRQLPNLKRLSLVRCPRVKDLAALDTLRGLRWIGLPQGVTQKQLMRIVRNHPKLVGLELFGCENIKDLSVIRELTQLRVLLNFSEASIEPLCGMKSLKFLAVLPGKLKARDVAQFKAKTPNCAVEVGAPICLGSGWILLLPVLIALAILIAAWRRRLARAQR